MKIAIKTYIVKDYFISVWYKHHTTIDWRRHLYTIIFMNFAVQIRVNRKKANLKKIGSRFYNMTLYLNNQ